MGRPRLLHCVIRNQFEEREVGEIRDFVWESGSDQGHVKEKGNILTPGNIHTKKMVHTVENGLCMK